ncbi:AMP-binding protein [Photobacterium halotolerans]|uniref:Long-chain-fatty-acid--CoA ligase n=1 Tax=Photobacterium halotolerans TaxID=265726 RepID=A0A0F5VA68_9GAMM|nr:AMP-binding protein [Photobacterium halotolerans]KKC98404.1 long-chain fatty acid--CoA ligase [Photobacterium halotolerans]
MDAYQYLNTFNNLADFLEDGFARYTHHPAFHCLGQTLTYSDIEQRSRHLAQWLQHQSGLQAGDRIAIQLPNIIQYPIAAYAAIRAGLVVVNTNPLYTPREMQHQFSDAGVKALIILEDLLPKYEAIRDQVPVENVLVTAATDLLTNSAEAGHHYIALNAAIASGKEQPALRPNTAGTDDIAVLQYTGGTTGVAKGACLTHGNILANAAQMSHRILQKGTPGEETFICPLPLYHIYAFTVNMMGLFYLGAQNVLIPNPRDIEGFIKTLQAHRFTGFAGINTLFVGLCQHPEFRKLDFSALKITFSGGAALTGKAFELWQSITGCTITEGWGLTETSPVSTLNNFDCQQINSVGVPLINTVVEVWDENQRPLPQGEVGELVIKGPQVMQGYWQRPDETAKVLVNGFVKTGDLGLITTEGYIKIVDRLKDMIIVSGFNVYPNEIEEVLCRHEHIVEAAVVGETDDKTGEAVHAHITTSARLDEAEIIAFCREHLTAYKIPKRISVHQELPKSTVGKILRRELRPA